jgi:hypothetical protein
MTAAGYRGGSDGAAAQRAIHCKGTVLHCSRMQRSSVTDLTAAVFQHSIGTREARRDSDGNTYFLKKLLGSVVVSGDLVLETDEGRVKVPEGAFRFDAHEHIEMMPSTAGPIPEVCRHLVEPGMVLYGERFLSVGDIVELTATVRPCRDPEIEYEVVAEHDAVIVDRTLEEMGIDVEGLRSRNSRMALIAVASMAIVVIAVVVATVIGIVW